MANMRGPRFKLCRRLGTNVCGHPKAMKRVAKGKDGKILRSKSSQYGMQLTEKQKLKAYYGVLEKQFIRYVSKAMRSKEVTGDALVALLETRLDSIVYRIGLANSIRQARQMVVHGHVLVNGKRIDRPSYQLSVGDVVMLREKSRKNSLFTANMGNANPWNLKYIEVDAENFSGKLTAMPLREEVPIEVEDHLIVEFYSKKKV